MVWRALIVDPDATVAERLSTAPNRVQIKSASHIADALTLTTEEWFDVIVVATTLADGRGLDLVRTLRSDDGTATRPIIMAASLHDEEQRERALAAGADACITKPIDVDELVRASTRALERHQIVPSLSSPPGSSFNRWGLAVQERAREHEPVSEEIDLRTERDSLLHELAALRVRLAALVGQHDRDTDAMLVLQESLRVARADLEQLRSALPNRGEPLEQHGSSAVHGLTD